ncbi:MAG TPA: hypothetical protein VIP70_09235 [Nitrososphaeraceae archaeon]
MNVRNKSELIVRTLEVAKEGASKTDDLRKITDKDDSVMTYASKYFNKVLVIGLGQLGLPVAKYIKDIRLGGRGRGGGEKISSSSSADNAIASINSSNSNNNSSSSNNSAIAQEKHEIKTAPTIPVAAATTITTTRNSLGIPMHPVPEVEIVELTKIVENAHRYLQIAFAEDLYLYCQANNINFAQLRDSLNTKWNVNILEPREGIGDHYLPKDTTMFLNSSPKSIRSKIIQAAIEVDKEYRIAIKRSK